MQQACIKSNFHARYNVQFLLKHHLGNIMAVVVLLNFIVLNWEVFYFSVHLIYVNDGRLNFKTTLYNLV